MLLWTLVCIHLFQLVFLLFLDIYPGLELPDHMIAFFIFFEEPIHCFPSWLYWSTFTPTVYKDFLLSTSSPTFAIFKLLFLTMQCSMWGLSSLTRDQTHTSYNGSMESTSKPPGESLFVDFLMFIILADVRWYLMVVLIFISLILVIGIFPCSP